MTICETCGRDVHRRSRLDDGRLVCWQCHLIKNASFNELCRIYKETEDYGRRGWDKCNDLWRRKKLPSLFSAIPDIDTLRRACIALDLTKNYGQFYEVLANHYNIPTPNTYVAPNEVPPNSIACYSPSKKAIISKNTTMSKATALHEWWHYMEDLRLVYCPNEMKTRQRNANMFAQACLSMLGDFP